MGIVLIKEVFGYWSVSNMIWLFFFGEKEGYLCGVLIVLFLGLVSGVKIGFLLFIIVFIMDFWCLRLYNDV